MLSSHPISAPSPGTSAPRRCSVIIPVHDGGAVFQRCLASVTAALGPADELIVVADGESDGAWRAAHDFPCRVLRVPRHCGPAGARNHGAAEAKGEFIVFIDADVTVAPDCLDRMVQRFADEPGLVALIGSYDDAPGDPGFVSQYRNLLHHYVHQRGATEASTFWGACGAIRRDIFLAAGGFDENYARSSIEDIELGYRLRAASHRLRLAREIQVKHWKKWTAWMLWRSDTLDRAMPWTELILEQYTRGRRLVVARDLNLGLSYQVSLLVSWSFLGALAASPFLPAAGWAVALLGALFLLLHLPLLLFFQRRRGMVFAIRALPWRFLYDLCSGLGFIFGLARFCGRSWNSAPVASGSSAPTAGGEAFRQITESVGGLPDTEQESHPEGARPGLLRERAAETSGVELPVRL